MVMKVERQQVVDVFKAIGFNTADTWSDDRLKTKLLKLPELTSEVDLGSFEGELASLVEKMVKAIEADPKTTFVFEGEDKSEGKNKKKKDKLTKKTEDKDGKKKDKSPLTAPKPAKKVRGMSRIEAVVVVLKAIEKSLSIEKAAEKSNALYMQRGGKDNIKESLFHVKNVSNVMGCLDMVECDGENIRRKTE